MRDDYFQDGSPRFTAHLGPGFKVWASVRRLGFRGGWGKCRPTSLEAMGFNY